MKVKRLISLLLTIAILSTVALSSVSAATNSDNTTGASSYFNMNKYMNQTYDGEDLGCTYTPEATTWKVWSPPAEKVQLKLYTTGTDRENGAKVLGIYDLTKNADFSKNGVWEIKLDGDYKNVYYTYLVTTANTHGVVETTETQDIYSKAVGANGDRSMVVDLDDTDPEGWDEDKHVVFDDITKTTVWELHIRDFSCDPNSGVSEANRGDYLAFTEGGTTLKSDTSEKSISTGIDYLVEQGINCVQLMPFADFDQVDEVTVTDDQKHEKRNWGYNPKNYNVPDGTYASDAYDGNVRINEVKQMIQALHDRGISVIMDVVYNHTAGYEASCFTKTVPGYYYRMSSSVQYIDGSGQGCELASENKMVRNFIVQSLKYWVEEYHIDGFRFDLMYCIDCDTLNEARDTINSIYEDKTGEKISMYGEPWAGGDSGCTKPAAASNQGLLKSGIGMFGAAMRDVATAIEQPLKGSWVTTGDTSSTGEVVKGIMADHISTTDNTKTVTYAECHDKYTLWDKITGAINISGQGKKAVSKAPDKDSTDARYTDRLKLGGALFTTSQGIVFLQAGTEFARTKNGQDNSYNSYDEINQLDWTRVPRYQNVVDYYRGLNRIHEVYSPFSDDTETSENTMKFISNTGNVIAYTIDNVTENKDNEWGTVAVLLNNGEESQTVNLGASGWEVVANKQSAGLTSLETVEGSTYTLEARSAAILVEKNSYKDFSDEFKYGTLTTNHYVGEELVKTTTAKYRINYSTYHALTDRELLVNNDLVKTEGQTSGAFTGDVTVNYTYAPKTTKIGKLTVNYINTYDEKVTPSMEYLLEEGETYNIPVCAVQGYQLKTNSYPENTTGVFDGNDKVINFVYKELESDVVTIHYKNTNKWRTVLCYAYTDDGEEPLGAWNASNANKAAKMTAENPDDPYGWYTIDIPIASCKVMFYCIGQYPAQEPGQNEPGYSVAGECWVENKIVTYSSTIVISCIDIDTGLNVAHDETITDIKKSTESYKVDYTKAANNSEYVLGELVNSPSNCEGFYQPGVTNVVYLFKEGKPFAIPDPPPGVNYYLSGDANCDGVVNINDVTLIQQSMVDIISLDTYNVMCADVDMDYEVTMFDALSIQKEINMIKNPELKINRYLKRDEYKAEEEEEEEEIAGKEVLFTDGNKWADIHGKLYVYCWNEKGEATAWPGTEMTFYSDNDGFGNTQYSFILPEGYTHFCISTGLTGYQTEFMKYNGETGFYLEGTKDSTGKYKLLSW